MCYLILKNSFYLRQFLKIPHFSSSDLLTGSYLPVGICLFFFIFFLKFIPYLVDRLYPKVTMNLVKLDVKTKSLRNKSSSTITLHWVAQQVLIIEKPGLGNIQELSEDFTIMDTRQGFLKYRK